MANITIYVSDELRAALAHSDVPISQTCQNALRDALRAEGHGRPGRPFPGQTSITQEIQ